MGDSRRFDLFAKFVSNKIPKHFKIADVSAGKGYLQSALRELGFTNIVSFDKRKKHVKGTRQYKWFNCNTEEKFDSVIAMHPDEGTDHSIVYAVKHRVPAFVCPCCVKPDAVVYWQSSCDYHAWTKHLERLATKFGREVTWHKLGMSGKNDVMWIH